MKKITILLFIAAVGTQTNINAQGLLKRMANKAAQKAGDRAVDKAIDKADKATDPKSKTQNEETTAQEELPEKKEAVVPEVPAAIRSYSRYDFVPGERLVFSEDFEQDVVGECPVNWFTNGSAEVVKLDNYPGRWLMPTNGSLLSPTFVIPADFTLEFDLIVDLDLKSTAVYPNMNFSLFDRGEKTKRLDYYNYKLVNFLNFNNSFQRTAVYIKMDSRENSVTKIAGAKSELTGFQKNYQKITHVALWVQKERMRLWYNEDKVFDAPTGAPLNANFNQFMIDGSKTREGKPGFYFANFKLAAGTPDTRTKLFVEGKFSTTGILFDSNSDVIKPASAGTIKQIAELLKSDGAAKVKIIGHTDGDGNAAANLILSKKRAVAVKNALINEFGIPATSLETDGLGDSKPVADNKTALGKAQNRRVEFIKL